MATKGTAWLVRRSRDLVPALAGLAVREWLGLSRDVPEPDSTELEYPGQEIPEREIPEREIPALGVPGLDSPGLEPVNLNALSGRSGNLELYEW
jgi:hypothetical protein